MSIGILLNVFARYPFAVLACLLLGGGILLGVTGLITGIQLFNLLSVVLIVCGLAVISVKILLKLGYQKS
ncbi:MAG: hypothetical protein Q6368_011160 [Candidatus Baldrarchaeota archaeon]